MAPRARPVGDEQHQVVVEPLLRRVEPVADEHRETQVVANQWAHPPSADLDDQAIAAGGIPLVLASHPEQVAFVVMRQRSIGTRPDQAVANTFAVANHLAAGDDGADLARQIAHPAHVDAIHGLGIGDGVIGKAREESLRQHNQVGATGQRQNLCPIKLTIGPRVVPDGCRLHQRNAQIAHSRSAAAPMVASVLAKQKRTSFWSGGDS